MALYHFKMHRSAPTTTTGVITDQTLAIDVTRPRDLRRTITNSSSSGLTWSVREIVAVPSMTPMRTATTTIATRPIRRKVSRPRQTNNMTDMDNTILIADEPSCIDLTEDDEIIEIQTPNPTDPTSTNSGEVPVQNEPGNVEIVASTSTITLRNRNVIRNNSIAIARDQTSPRASIRNRPTAITAVVNLSQESDDELPEVFMESSPKGANKKKPSKETKVINLNKSSSIVCPVCLDDSRDVKNSSRQMVSTICGHLFCDTCLKNCFEAQKCCPTCRKKLKKNQFHPIYF